jgi:hypothetical protein
MNLVLSELYKFFTLNNGDDLVLFKWLSEIVFRKPALAGTAAEDGGLSKLNIFLKSSSYLKMTSGI